MKRWIVLKKKPALPWPLPLTATHYSRNLPFCAASPNTARSTRLRCDGVLQMPYSRSTVTHLKDAERRATGETKAKAAVSAAEKRRRNSSQQIYPAELAASLFRGNSFPFFEFSQFRNLADP